MALSKAVTETEKTYKISPKEWVLPSRDAHPSLYRRHPRVYLDMKTIRENVRMLTHESIPAAMVGFLIREILKFPLRIAESEPVFDGAKRQAHHLFLNTQSRGYIPRVLTNHLAAGFCGHTFRPHAEFGGSPCAIDFDLVRVSTETSADGTKLFIYEPEGEFPSEYTKLAVDSKHHSLHGAATPTVYTDVTREPAADGTVRSLMSTLRTHVELLALYQQLGLAVERAKAYPVVYTSRKEPPPNKDPSQQAANQYINAVYDPNCPQTEAGFRNMVRGPEMDEERARLDAEQRRRDAATQFAKLRATLANQGFSAGAIKAMLRFGGPGAFGDGSHRPHPLKIGETIERGPQMLPAVSIVELRENIEISSGALWGLPRQNWAEALRGNKLKTNASRDTSASDIAKTTVKYWCTVMASALERIYRMIYTDHVRSKLKGKITKAAATTTKRKADALDAAVQTKRLKESHAVLKQIRNQFTNPPPAFEGYEGNVGHGPQLPNAADDDHDLDYSIRATFTFPTTVDYAAVEDLYARGLVEWKVLRSLAALHAGLDESDLVKVAPSLPEPNGGGVAPTKKKKPAAAAAKPKVKPAAKPKPKPKPVPKKKAAATVKASAITTLPSDAETEEEEEEDNDDDDDDDDDDS